MDTTPTVLLAVVVGVLVITLLAFLLPGAWRRLRYRRADRRRELMLARAEENPPMLPSPTPVEIEPVADRVSDSPPQGEPFLVEDDTSPDSDISAEVPNVTGSPWVASGAVDASTGDAEWVVDPTLPTPPANNPAPTPADVSRVVEALSLGLSEDVTLEPAGPVTVQAAWAGLDLVNAVLEHSDITNDLRQEWIVVASDGFEVGRVDVTWVWADDVAEWKILRLPALAF